MVGAAGLGFETPRTGGGGAGGVERTGAAGFGGVSFGAAGAGLADFVPAGIVRSPVGETDRVVAGAAGFPGDCGVAVSNAWFGPLMTVF